MTETRAQQSSKYNIPLIKHQSLKWQAAGKKGESVEILLHAKYRNIFQFTLSNVQSREKLAEFSKKIPSWNGFPALFSSLSSHLATTYTRRKGDNINNNSDNIDQIQQVNVAEINLHF